MSRAPKIAVLGLLALVTVAAAVLLGGEDDDDDDAARAPGCAEGERARASDPDEAGVKGGRPVLLACVRPRRGIRAQVIGYPLNGRPCIDEIDSSTGEGGGCNDEIGQSPVEVGSRSFRAGRGERISGRTDPRAVRVRVRYLATTGCIGHTRAGYVAIRDPVALRRSANRTPFGFYVVELPRGAKPLTLEAVARQGRLLGEARLGAERAVGAPPAGASPVCRRPYVGVACARPNSAACDRVGVSVPASLFVERVTATVAGRRLKLRTSRTVGRDGRGTFVGFLQPAGLRTGRLRVKTEPGTDRWLGDPPVTVPLRLDVRYAGGRQATRTFRLPLQPGYG